MQKNLNSQISLMKKSRKSKNSPFNPNATRIANFISQNFTAAFIPLKKYILSNFCFEKIKSKENLQKIIICILGFAFGSTSVFGTSFPFGIALFCASTGQNAIFSLLGVGLSFIMRPSLLSVQFCAIILLYILRKAFTSSAFMEKIQTRLLENFLVCAFISFASALSKGFSVHIVLTQLSFICISLLCTYLYSGIISEKRQKITSNYYIISLLCLIFTLLLSISPLKPFGISLALIFAVVISLMFSKANGALYGCVCAFLCGFSLGDAKLSCALGLAGLISGALYTFKSYVTAIAFGICTIFSAIYFSSFSILNDILPETVCGCIIFALLSGNIPDFLRVTSKVQIRTKAQKPLEKSQFKNVSDTLSGISSMFFKLSDSLKHPPAPQVLCLIDDAFSDICSSCSCNSYCYAKKQCDFEELKQKCISLLRNHELLEKSFSALLSDKCINCAKLCDLINQNYTQLAFDHIKSNKTKNLAGHYSSVSRLINSTEKQVQQSRVHDERLEKIISKALLDIDLPHTFVNVFGSREKDIEIHGIKPDKIPLSSSDLSSFLSKKCGFALTEPSFDISEKDDMTINLSRRDCIEIEYAKSDFALDGGDINGDTACFFENDKGYFYTLISDGMGSGANAAMTSRLSCMFLEKMLCSGCAKNVSLEMLNNLLLSKNDETFATVDLLEIDKYNKSATFLKAGAGASFILRKSRLYKIFSQTPPCGIIESFNAENTHIPLENGDVIIMMSDGIVQSPDDGVWLSELIRIDTMDEPALLCAKIIEKAKVINKRADDMSVCVVKIK